MTILGVPLRTVVRLAREAREVAAPGPILVVGTLAPQLARLLVADGGDRWLVQTGSGDPAGAAAVICVLGGAPTAEQVAVLRSAARAGIPAVAVQTGAAATLPYVLPGDVVGCPPGHGFPVDEIAHALCRRLGRGAAPLAARLPALRNAAVRAVTTRAVVTAAGLAAAPWAPRRHLPRLVQLQARMLRDLAVASGSPRPVSQEEVGVVVGPELGVPLALGLAARAAVRRLPRHRAIDASAAGGVTVALAALAALARGVR